MSPVWPAASIFGLPVGTSVTEVTAETGVFALTGTLNAMTDVVVRDLHKSFGERRVLAGVDLEVSEGSLTAVLGPSGSGKTTLLRILAGFERADQGEVFIGGEPVESSAAHVPPEERRTGYVPQEGALFPHLDAAANVGFGLPRRERKGARVDELLALVGLEGVARLYPHQLSGGQQQRVALARALAIRPSLVLLDEPFSSLDASLRSEVRSDVVRVLGETGTTAVLVTHDQDEALSLAHRVAVLQDGRIAQVAGPEELYTEPAGPTVAKFVGDANLFRATVRGGRAESALGSLELSLTKGPFDEGQAVVVLVRPEQVALSAAGGATGGTVGTVGTGNGTGSLPGRVSKCEFYGHDMLVTVEVEDGSGIPSLQARLAGGRPLPTGSRVGVRVTGAVLAWALN